MEATALKPPRSGRRGRAGLANALLAVGSLAVFLGLAEAAARLFDLRPRAGTAAANAPWLDNRWLLPREDYRERLAEAGALARYYDLYEWDRYLFYRLRPGRDVELIDPMAPEDVRARTRWSVRTGAHGFRGAPLADPPIPGRPRILALGDSSTFGWGVEEFEAYPARLAEALSRRRGGAPVEIEVGNLGVPGYSTFQGRVLLEREALPRAPDVVTWSFLSNDGAATGERDDETYARRQGFGGALLAALHRSRAFETLEAWIAQARTRLSPPAPVNPSDPAARNVPGQDAALRNVLDAVAAARAADVPIVLIGLCTRPPVSDTLTRAAEQAGVPFLDATALLDAAIPRIASEREFARERRQLAKRYGAERLRAQPRLYAFLPDACHPNAIGHRLIAEALAEHVEPLLPASAP